VLAKLAAAAPAPLVPCAPRQIEFSRLNLAYTVRRASS
jgi:hypothetical protein